MTKDTVPRNSLTLTHMGLEEENCCLHAATKLGMPTANRHTNSTNQDSDIAVTSLAR